uniref:Ig-like domain-containing protein n=1 Tax=Cyclopterus lumpus TaxID=8103 RepID=A0A8C2ZHK9_CYCLU
MSYVSLLILAGPLGKCYALYRTHASMITNDFFYIITTVSRVSVKAGDSISIPCLYGSQYTNHVKYLCYGYYWMTCSTEVTTETQSRKFSISDDKIQRIFTVTLKDLTNNDSGYYWCAVEIDKGPDVRNHFNLSVTKGKKITFNCQSQQQVRTIDCFSQLKSATWCRLGGSCVTSQTGSINGTRVTINSSVPNVFAVTMYGLRKDSSGWYSCFHKGCDSHHHPRLTAAGWSRCLFWMEDDDET